MIIVQIAGRLGKDAESRFTPSGQKVSTMNVAVNVRKGGKEETVWWRVTMWGDRYDKMLPYLKKGSAVIVVGEMSKPEIWTDKEGRPQVSVEMTAEIVRFSPFGNPEKQDSNSGTSQNSNFNQNNSSNGPYNSSEQDNSFGEGAMRGTSSNKFESSNDFGDDSIPF